MGLFSNNKKLCPICNNPTPRLLPTKIEGMPICKECDHKIDLPDGKVNQMSLEEFQKYINFYDENQAMRNEFSATYHMDRGFFGGSFAIDVLHRWFRLKDNDTSLVMDSSNLKSFRILEDNSVLFEGNANALKCHDNNVEARAQALSPRIAQFRMEQQQYEMLEHLEEMRERHSDNQDDKNQNRPYRSRPYFDVDAPVKKFHVELELMHPYWEFYTWKVDAPSFDREYPSVEGYMSEYRSRTDELHTLATNLMQVINPNAPEISDGATAQAAAAAPQAAPATNTVEELQKYKELMDSGVITEEEFTAKKRQLLGI